MSGTATLSACPQRGEHDMRGADATRAVQGFLQCRRPAAVLRLTAPAEHSTMVEPLDSTTCALSELWMPPPACAHEAWGTRAVSDQLS